MLGDRYASSKPSSAACRYASPGPAHQMSPLGLARSALICANVSPVAFCTTATLLPVAFSKPTAMPWHHAVLGELQYMLSCATAGVAATSTSAAVKAKGMRMVDTWDLPDSDGSPRDCNIRSRSRAASTACRIVAREAPSRRG